VHLGIIEVHVLPPQPAQFARPHAGEDGRDEERALAPRSGSRQDLRYLRRARDVDPDLEPALASLVRRDDAIGDVLSNVAAAPGVLEDSLEAIQDRRST
jgi:hypothetical protein